LFIIARFSVHQLLILLEQLLDLFVVSGQELHGIRRAAGARARGLAGGAGFGGLGRFGLARSGFLGSGCGHDVRSFWFECREGARRAFYMANGMPPPQERAAMHTPAEIPPRTGVLSFP